ncbi:MAG: LysR substrate-binding domain-containing protein [Thiotrichales bacterium]|nr:LysR substrate-binding domain-containing protein [Thiotrichales bacterium]
MKELRELTRSAHHLMVFEAAARNQSFTVAAHELNVTQPAVSRSVRQLEAALGVSLFTRSHRSVALTEAGEILSQAVSAGFGRILEAARRLSHRTQSHVTLLTSTAVANYWLLPRLPDFHNRHPDIDLRFQVSDRHLELAEESSSLGIRLGDGNWPGYDCELLAEEEVFPVASPGFAATLEAADDPGVLVGERLIHIEEPFLPSLTWSDWFTEMNTDYHDDGTGLRLNHYVLVLQAAMAGEGIAIGWTHLVDYLIGQGLLVRVGNRRWRTGRSFYLIWSNRTQLSPQAESVRTWIIEAASSRSPSRRSIAID